MGIPALDPTLREVMALGTLAWTPGKSEYTEAEAAAVLGITPEELRELLRTHIVKDELDLEDVRGFTYRPSDLLMLTLVCSEDPGVAPCG